MANVKIHEPRSQGGQAQAAPQLKAFLSLGFRPLYLVGSAWALISIFIWIYLPSMLTGPLAGPFWHAHEMLWGFITTIAVAFLLTASATWTGHNPLWGWPLAVTTVLWLVARVGFLIDHSNAFIVACLAESAFYAIVTIALARVILKGKSTRNYGIPIMVAAFGVSNAVYLHAIKEGYYTELARYFDIGLICMAVVALLIARRVIPFFAMRAVSGLKIPMLTCSGQIQITAGVIAIAAAVLQLPYLMAIALLVSGLIALYQISRWQPAAVLGKPILWILYLGYTVMAIGLLAAAAYMAGFKVAILARPAGYVHLIGMGGFCVLIIGMLTRTALGHLGRPLQLDRSMVISYWLMILAVILRIAALWPSSSTQTLLHLAGAAWVLLFALYLWRFAPLLIRPRP